MDDDLRELERAVATKGDAASRLRLARALERAGRKDEVWAVLRPAVSDREVRRAVLELPAWRYSEGDAGRTNVLDVPPLVRVGRPRVLRASLGDRFPDVLLASEAGLVLGERVRGGSRVLLLDVASGDERESFLVERTRSGTVEIAIAGERVVSTPGADELVARDLTTGEVLHEEPLGGRLLLALDAATVVVHTGGALGAYAWRPGGWLSALWEAPIASARCSAAAAASWVVAWSEAGELVALRRRDGAPLWTQHVSPGAEAARMDEQGLVVVRAGAGDGSEFFVLDREGNVLWSSEPSAVPMALGKDWIVATVRHGRRGDLELVVYDRVTGERRAVLHGALGYWNEIVCVACTRETVYFTAPREKALLAANLKGDVLWRVSLDPLEGLGQALALAPGAHRLHAALAGGAVVAFDEDLC